jgi:hypothetical protein
MYFLMHFVIYFSIEKWQGDLGIWPRSDTGQTEQGAWAAHSRACTRVPRRSCECIVYVCVACVLFSNFFLSFNQSI